MASDTLPVDVAHHSALVERLYVALEALDADTAQSCYASDAVFEDPIYRLRGREAIGGMWRMLCSGVRGQGRAVWQLRFGEVQVDAVNGRVHWDADYRYAPTGRTVHQSVDARFKFRDGLIAEHHDSFDFWAWSRQALGTSGTLLGWSPMFRARVGARSTAALQAYVRRNPSRPLPAR